MKSKVMYLLIVIMILASCAGNRKYDDLMQRADSIMVEDSCICTLQQGASPALARYGSADHDAAPKQE